DLLPLSVRRPHSSTLFPYTTLFRSQPVPDRAHRVRDRRADVAEQVAVEFVQALARVLQLRRLHLLQHPRMAQDRALAEDHQRAGHDVRALDGDADRGRLPAAAEVVARAEDDALAA